MHANYAKVVRVTRSVGPAPLDINVFEMVHAVLSNSVTHHDPAGNRTTRRPPDHHKEMQNKMVRIYPLFIRSGQHHLARHSKKGKKTRQTEEEVGRQHPGINRPGVPQVPVENRQKWRKLAVKSSVVPNNPCIKRNVR